MPGESFRATSGTPSVLVVGQRQTIRGGLRGQARRDRAGGLRAARTRRPGGATGQRRPRERAGARRCRRPCAARPSTRRRSRTSRSRARAPRPTRSGTRSRRRAARDLVLELDAAGDLDAVVDVFRRDRSQLSSLACGQTNRRGRLTLDFSQPRNAPLLVRVAQRENSASDAFSLRVVAPDAPERPPGRALGGSGASASVDRIANPDDAYGVSMSRRPHLPRARRLARALRVGVAVPAGHVVVLRRLAGAQLRLRRVLPLHARPGEGGRYSIQVRAPRSRRGALPYHLQVARAGEDDTAPGLAARQRRARARGAARERGRRRRPLPLRRAAGRASSTCG